MTRDRLALALSAHAAIGGPSHILAALRIGGLDELARCADSLHAETRERIAREAVELEEGGVDVLFVGEARFPARVAALPNPPPILYYRGNVALLEEPSISMCGSRDASPEGLDAAAIAGRTVAASGLTIVSGHARGVDVETHVAAIAAGGSTIIVLAEGIARFRLKRALADAGIPPESLLVLSQFPPRQGWTVGGAMTRNALIAALGLALVVIEAGETGGTLDAGLKGLDLNRPVLALGFRSGHRAGNEILQSKGAWLIPSTGALRDAIAMIRRSAGDQMRLFDSAATSTGPFVRP